MRFVECCTVGLLVMTPSASRILAQNAAPVPAAVTPRAEMVSESQGSLDSTRTPLRAHMRTGAIIGGFAGLGLAGIALAAIFSTDCPVFAPSNVPALGGDCSRPSVGKVLFGSAAAGAILG